MSSQPWQTFGASGSSAFGLAASGLSAFGFAASELVGFQFVFPRLMVSGLVVAGSMVFLCGVRFGFGGSRF